VAGIAFSAVLYLEGYAKGSYLLPSIFAGLFVAWIVVGTYAHRHRRPMRLGFSAEEVRLVYEGDRTRRLSWDAMVSVQLSRFLGDVAAEIRYGDGRVEDKAHIYGEAALELKRRFEEWRASSRP
jgi:hypothetical protein